MHRTRAAPRHGPLRLRDVPRELAVAETGAPGLLFARTARRLARRHRSVQPLHFGKSARGLHVANDHEYRVGGCVEVAVEAQQVVARQATQPLLASDAPAPNAMPVMQQLEQRLDSDGARIVRLAFGFLDDDLELARELVPVDQ